MYLSKIHLENIRCLKDLTIDLYSEQNLSKWALILGDNGVGKTSVLRCVAMGMCDATSASALLKEISGDMISDDADIARIELELIDKATPQKYWIRTKLIRSSSDDVNVEQEKSEAFPWQDIFLCGYGAGRIGYASSDYDKYSTINSVYTLFNYESDLQNPELVLRRLKDEIDIQQITRSLERVMMLPEGSTRLTRSGLMVSGPWGGFKPSGSLGDGYQAVLGLIGDLMEWWGMFHEEKILSAELEGIVLVDELEQHLHPRWQQSIVKLLHEQFPRIQFLATTHSPLCAIGTSDLKDEECELVLLRQIDGKVEGLDDQKPPRRLRADQVLTSYLFGLDHTRSRDVARDIQRYADLKSMKSLTAEEEQEFEALHSRLSEDLGSEETELQQIVSKSIKRTLETFPQEMKSANLDPEAVDFEIKRQLRDLFDFSGTR